MNGRGEDWRHELKYLLPASELAAAERRIAALLPPDAHWGAEGYTVSSLYFDTPGRSCLADNDAGSGRRVKYRIRLYNHRLGEIFLERKEKRYALCRKESCLLTREDLALLREGKTPPRTEGTPALLTELVLRMKTTGLAPSAVITYERRAYTGRPGNVRITFDRCISASRDTEGFGLRSGIRCPVLDAGTELLEVKYDRILPEVIRDLLQTQRMRQDTFSKYDRGCRILDKYWRDME